uniref:t-SNARE coiled-coil homology domain-containing protein n=1 Tax=Rhabditophanes sp. KR3021 TaxID=114890 RepID=A0AC35UBP3_9BILA
MNAANFVPTDEVQTYEEFVKIRDNCRKQSLHDQISYLRRAVTEADKIGQLEFDVDVDMSDAAIEKSEQDVEKAMRALRLVYNSICDDAKKEILNIKVSSLNLRKYINRECSSIGDFYSMEAFEYLIGDDDLGFPDLMEFMYTELEKYINVNNMHNTISLPTGEMTKEWMLAYRSDTKNVDKLPFDNLSFDKLLIGVMRQFIIAKENYFNHLYGVEENRAKLELEKVSNLISDAMFENVQDNINDGDNTSDVEDDEDGSSISGESIEMMQEEPLENNHIEEHIGYEAVEQPMGNMAVKESIENEASENFMKKIAVEESMNVDHSHKNVVHNVINEVQSKPNSEIPLIVISDDSDDEIEFLGQYFNMLSAAMSPRRSSATDLHAHQKDSVSRTKFSFVRSEEGVVAKPNGEWFVHHDSNDEPCDEQNIQVEQLLLDSDDDSVLSKNKENEEALQLRRQEELICQMSKERDQMVHKAFIFVAAIVCIMPLGYGFTKKMAN